LVSLASNYTMRAVAFKRKDQHRGRWIGKHYIGNSLSGKKIGLATIASLSDAEFPSGVSARIDSYYMTRQT
jgi:hypothetical protein